MVQELTADNFQQAVIDSPLPVLLDFWSPNCAPCLRIAPVLDALDAEAGGRFRVGKVNAWEEQGLAVRYRISAVPALLVFKGGAVVNTLVGYQDKRKLVEALEPALDGHAAGNGHGNGPHGRNA
jgi:thioredoxin